MKFLNDRSGWHVENGVKGCRENRNQRQLWILLCQRWSLAQCGSIRGDVNSKYI